MGIATIGNAQNLLVNYTKNNPKWIGLKFYVPPFDAFVANTEYYLPCNEALGVSSYAWYRCDETSIISSNVAGAAATVEGAKFTAGVATNFHHGAFNCLVFNSSYVDCGAWLATRLKIATNEALVRLRNNADTFKVDITHTGGKLRLTFTYPTSPTKFVDFDLAADAWYNISVLTNRTTANPLVTTLYVSVNGVEQLLTAGNEANTQTFSQIVSTTNLLICKGLAVGSAGSYIARQNYTTTTMYKEALLQMLNNWKTNYTAIHPVLWTERPTE